MENINRHTVIECRTVPEFIELIKNQIASANKELRKVYDEFCTTFSSTKSYKQFIKYYSPSISKVDQKKQEEFLALNLPRKDDSIIRHMKARLQSWQFSRQNIFESINDIHSVINESEWREKYSEIYSLVGKTKYLPLGLRWLAHCHESNLYRIQEYLREQSGKGRLITKRQRIALYLSVELIIPLKFE